MSTHNNLTTIAAVVALAFGLAACSSSSDTASSMPEPEPAPTPVAVDLKGSTDLMAGTTTIPAGGSSTVGQTTLSCAGTEACELTVMRDPVTGTYSATSTGGMVTVAVAPAPEPEPEPEPPVASAVDLKGSTDLTAGTTTIPAGRSSTAGRTTLSCAGTEDCVLTVTKDPVTGGYSATSTGGMVTVAVAPAPEPEPEPEPAVPMDLALPVGHGLTVHEDDDDNAESFTVRAGQSRQFGNTVFTCAAGGEDCMVTVSEILGVVSATYTGGMVTAVLEAPPSGLTQEQMMQLGDLLEDGGDGTIPVSGLGKGIGRIDVDYGQAATIMSAVGQPVFAAASAPPAIDDWTGSALERTNADGSVDRVVVYAPTSAPEGSTTTFAIKYGGKAGKNDNVTLSSTTPSELPSTGLSGIKVTGQEDYIPAPPALGAALPPNKVISLTDTLQSVSFTGTFDGVAGVFTCKGTGGQGTCTLGRQADGDLTVAVSNASVTFKAHDANAVISLDSNSFSAFGWWLQTPEGDEDLESFLPYAYVADDTKASRASLASVTESATYRGPAAGRYVKRDAGDSFAVTGAFTASARIRADFDATITGDNPDTTDDVETSYPGISLSGRITGFKDADGNSLGFGRVTFVGALGDIESGSTISATEFSGSIAEFDAHGLLEGTTGNWTAEFYNQSGTQQPGNIVGTFGAKAGNFERTALDKGYAAVGGAFSASQ